MNGPRAESYKPPSLGLPFPSKVTGLTICFTEMERISSVDRKPNCTVSTSEETGLEMLKPGMIVA